VGTKSEENEVNWCDFVKKLSEEGGDGRWVGHQESENTSGRSVENEEEERKSGEEEDRSVTGRRERSMHPSLLAKILPSFTPSGRWSPIVWATAYCHGCAEITHFFFVFG